MVKIKLVAHRGLHDNNSEENKIVAFEKAVNNNFLGIEFDVRETKDKKFVVIHDKNLLRTEGVFKEAKKSKYKELIKYKIPLLETVLSKYNEILKIVEIKEVKSFKKLIKLLNKYSNVYVCSFSKKRISRLNVVNRKYKLGIINNAINSKINYKVLDFYLFYYYIVSDNLIKYFKGNNKELFLFGLKTSDIKKYKREQIKYLYFIID